MFSGTLILIFTIGVSIAIPIAVLGSDNASINILSKTESERGAENE